MPLNHLLKKIDFILSSYVIDYLALCMQGVLKQIM